MLSTKNIFYKIISYAFILLTVLQCNSIYLYTSSPFHINRIILAIVYQIALVIMFIFSIKNSHIKDNSNLILFVFAFLITILILIIYNILFLNSYSSEGYILELAIDSILLTTCFYSETHINNSCKLFIEFENIIIFLAWTAFISWILFMIHVPTNVSALSSWGTSGGNLRLENGYLGLSYFVRNDTKFLGINWTRNAGIFAEPSMFSYVLVFALLVELFIKNDKNIFNLKIVILLLTVISTASTTGILVSIPAIIYHIIFVIHKNKSVKYLFILLLPIVFLSLKYVLSNKIGDANNSLTSFNGRMDDIIAGFRTWITHPLLGCGLGNSQTIESNVESSRIISSSDYFSDSSGFTMILAEGGSILGLLYLLPSIIVIKFRRNYIGLSIFLLILFIFVIAQNFYIYIMLLSYFWAIILRSNVKTNI